MRNIHVILTIVAAALSAGGLASCTDNTDTAAPDERQATSAVAPSLRSFIADHHLRTWAEIAPLIVARYGTARADEIEQALHTEDDVGAVPAEFLPVILPSGKIEVTEDMLRRYVSGELSPRRNFAEWVEAGLFDPHDADQVRAAADRLGVAPALPAAPLLVPPDAGAGSGSGSGAVCNWNCKIKLQLMVAKTKTSNGDTAGGHSCRQYTGDYWKKKWDGAEANFEASGGTVWRNNAFAPNYCEKDTGAAETGKHEVIGTVVMTTEALDATKPVSCPADLNAGVNLWGEAHQTAQLVCVAKSAGTYGFSFSNDDPWECYAQGGVGCSVSGVAEQQLIVTAEHKTQCDEKQAVSVGAKWTQDKGWELSGGGAAETTCKKTLDTEARGVVDCQIVHGPDVAWHSSDNPRPSVHATIGGKTFQAKARSLTSWRAGFWSNARRIRTDATAKTTATSAKVHIAASCSTNHPNDTGITCVVTGSQSDGY